MLSHNLLVCPETALSECESGTGLPHQLQPLASFQPPASLLLCTTVLYVNVHMLSMAWCCLPHTQMSNVAHMQYFDWIPSQDKAYMPDPTKW